MSEEGILFGFIFALAVMIIYPLALVIFSALAWGYNKFKRLSYVSYIIAAVLILFMINGNIAKMRTSFLYNRATARVIFADAALSAACFVSVIISMVFNKNNKALSCGLLNLSLLLAVIAFGI